MGKYSSRNTPPLPKIHREVHPVMRGIGCIMMVIVPILSYGVSVIAVNNFPIPLPRELVSGIVFPNWMKVLNGLNPILFYIESQPLMPAYVLFTVLISIFLFTIMAILYGFIYKTFGPSQYGPTDAPPIRKKVKKYTR
ncbi:MAG: hypothetical protein HXY35_06800 [Chloroflexi bacterium]|nr:hypothetical protein [Chloroflexota bacterium]